MCNRYSKTTTAESVRSTLKTNLHFNLMAGVPLFGDGDDLRRQGHRRFIAQICERSRREILTLVKGQIRLTS